MGRGKSLCWVRALHSIYIYFNNDVEAFAVRNAITLHRYLKVYNPR